ncbi:hypothetical protein M427DRAFT_26825 [Gonapodya prolifera JEL478]|uniref:MFS general substrate transporter n=1 Tax=Gonapodya prolifera (strain JEL478) TaxID=1344416 RepID=A0A139AZM8_GONPJ|nr:hypothetical protein M427DRAFT_26825 [Gonapodya prolifera JEL478]|eukprot:KXS22198.1 hypothetical protein M427DRAFT_26825 [Gonapodya prolifera JEL478]
MASSGPVFDGYMPGFILLGVAGLLMYMSVIHISVTFPARAGLLLAMISGAFDASGIVFPAYGWIYDAVGWKPTDFFWTYTSVPILLFCGNFLQPSESFEWASDDVIKVDPPGNTPVEEDLNRSLRKIDSDDTITPSLLASASSSESTPLLTPPPEEPAQGPSHGSAPARLSARDRYIQSLPVTEQLRTPEFFLNATWIFLTTVRINFYIATLAEQLGEMQGPGQEAMKESIVSVFNVANSIGAVAMIVPMGLIDTYPLYVNFLIQYFVFAFPFAVLGLVPSLPVQYITATLGGLIRPFMYTTTIQFASQTFGFKSFGRVYGLQMFVASLCNFLQYFLSWVALDVMGGQFFWVNVFLSVLQTAVLAFPLYLRRVSIVAAKTEADAS